MAENDFDKWHSELGEEVTLNKSLETPTPDDDAITYAQKLQYQIALAPIEEQQSLGDQALDRLQYYYGFETIGRGLFVHAMRAFMIAPGDENEGANAYQRSIRVKGYIAPFRFAKLPMESTIGLQLEMPTLLNEEKYSVGNLDLPVPLTIPVLGIEEHSIL